MLLVLRVSLVRTGSSRKDLQLRCTCAHEEHRLDEKVFAVEDMPALRMLCACESAEHIRPSLVFNPSYSGLEASEIQSAVAFMQRQEGARNTLPNFQRPTTGVTTPCRHTLVNDRKAGHAR